MGKRRICVFEDKADNYDMLERGLVAGLADRFEIKRYPGERQPTAEDDPHAPERWVRDFLMQPEPAALALVDYELDEYNQATSRLSVSATAQELFVPLVVYQGEDPVGKVKERLRRWQETRIAVEGATEKTLVAAKCVDVANGFEVIWEKVGGLEKPRLLETLKELLAPPSGATIHVEQYAIGNQEPLALVPHGAPQEDTPGDAYRKQRAVAAWMGYLIHNRVLQFPGPILGATAAAAYLAIDEAELSKTDVVEAFKDWRYTGPFRESLPAWWRWGLDRVVRTQTTKTDQEIPLGREALRRRLGRDVAAARCSENDHVLVEPGYLCILTRKAVCQAHSEAPEAWVPQGADRCRILATELDLLHGWLGL